MITTRAPPTGSAGVATLGGLLYADRAKTRVSESEWAELVESIATGDQFALRALYDATHRLVFTLLVRITHDRASAEELTLDVYHWIWERASKYDPAVGSVVGWVMNETRNRALDRLRFKQREKQIDRCPEDPLPEPAASESAQRLFLEQSLALQVALAALHPDERGAIESVFLSESTYAEVAATSNQPADVIRKRLASGMTKLRRALGGEIEDWSSSSAAGDDCCAHKESVFLYAMRALAPGEMFLVGAHVSACTECRRELEALVRVTDAFTCWPTDLLRPWANLWARLSRRISDESRERHVLAARRRRPESAWENVAPGIFCKLLATDTEKDRVSMLVRLEPGIAYPPHRHAGVEELHLLHGELWIDERKLSAGDFNRAEPGTADARVWSETGCTCVLITSPSDELR